MVDRLFYGDEQEKDMAGTILTPITLWGEFKTDSAPNMNVKDVTVDGDLRITRCYIDGRSVDGQKVKCWNDHKNGKHSALDIQGALNNSCNPIFVDMAMSLGKDTLYKYIDLFGCGKVTGIDFNGESHIYTSYPQEIFPWTKFKN